MELAPATDEEVAALEDPGAGFLVRRSFASDAEIDGYLAECAALFEAGPRSPAYPGYGRERHNRDSLPDYVLSRAGRPETRLYQFLENAHAEPARALFARGLRFRDDVERRWLAVPGYRALRAAQRDYVQVSRHREGEGIGRHSDAAVPQPRPLLQCVLWLSRPEIDYAGGDFVLHPRGGGAVRAQADLTIGRGDALFFDKALEHELLPTRAAASGAAERWSVVIGGRFGRPPAWRRAVRRLSQRLRAEPSG